MLVSVTLGFMLYTFRQTERKIIKKKTDRYGYLGGAILFVHMWAQVFVFLNVSMFMYVLLLGHTYIRIFAHKMACIFTYIYTYSRRLLIGKDWGKGTECEKGKVGERGWEKNCYNQIGFFFSWSYLSGC